MAALFFAPTDSPAATTVSARTELAGAVETQGGRWQKATLEIYPMLEGALGSVWTWRALARVRGDVFDELEPGSPRYPEVSSLSRRMLVGDRLELELREAYGEGTFGRLYLKLGKQQVVWGQADGLKVLDVVDPQSFREFILDDFSDSRIPLWTALAEVPVGPVTAQFLWIPDRTFHLVPREGAAYAFSSPRLVPPVPPGVMRDLRDPERPADYFGDGDFGARLSTFAAGFDLTLNYLYQYDNAPVLFREIDYSGLLPRVIVRPRYERTHVLGGSCATALGDVALRGEAAYFTDRFLSTGNPMDVDGVFRSGALAGVLGVDYTGIEKLFGSFQFFYDVVFRNAAGSFRDGTETVATLYLKYEAFDETLFPEIIWLHGFNLSDGLVRPKVVWEISDTRGFWVGADIFYGDARGLFGQFDARDRVVVGVTAHF